MTDRKILYNGINLPAQWPPRNIEAESTAPLPVPYLTNPPDSIPIDVEDCFLAESLRKEGFDRS